MVANVQPRRRRVLQQSWGVGARHDWPSLTRVTQNLLDAAGIHLAADGVKDRVVDALPRRQVALRGLPRDLTAAA